MIKERYRAVGSVLAATVSSMVWAFSPVITDTRTEQDVESGAVTVSYRLSGGPCIVTADVQTNAPNAGGWMSIGAENYTGITGDVWREVVPSESVHIIRWPATADGHRPIHFNRRARIVLTAWSTNAPPDYMVVDLADASSKPTYYTCEALLPEGGSVTNRVYKDRYLVMRRIRAAGLTWMMSNDDVAKMALASENRRIGEIPHPVMLSHDYYIGVYEVTKAQAARINGTMSEGGEADCRPCNWVSYNDAGRYIARLRQRTELSCADLPTEAQWEFAARAGSRSLMLNGYAYTGENLKKVARCAGNVKTADCEGLIASLATVGSYEPNSFGLYDMLGNVAEFALDRLADWSTCNNGGPISSSDVTIDPIGPSEGKFLLCGGMYDWGLGYVYIGSRHLVADGASASSGYYGFRVALTLR